MTRILARMRSMRCRTLVFGVIGAIAVVAAVDGGAYAYWTSHGSGSGVATISNPANITLAAVTAGDAVTTTLIPGGSGDVLLRVANPNSFTASLTGVSAGSITGTSGCPGSNVTFAIPSGLPLAISPTGAGSQLVDLAAAVTMASNAPSACQGVKFSIPVTITVQK